MDELFKIGTRHNIKELQKQVKELQQSTTPVSYTPSYKSYDIILTNSSGVITVDRELRNDFGVIFTWSTIIGSNGTIYTDAGAGKTPFTSGKTIVMPSFVNGGGVLYGTGLNPFSSTQSIGIDLIQLSNNSQTGTPNFTTEHFEIRVYN